MLMKIGFSKKKISGFSLKFPSFSTNLDLTWFTCTCIRYHQNSHFSQKLKLFSNSSPSFTLKNLFENKN